MKLSRLGWLALFSACVLYGQAELATITGVVTDPAQGLMPGVTVTVRNTDTNISHTLATNERGYFTVTDLPPGPYELTASKTGFAAYRETRIVLETGETLRSDVRLQVGSVAETVTVTADPAPLNTENGAIKGDVIVYSEIEDMPLNGRNFTDLTYTVPGVVSNAQGGSGGIIAVNGARSDSTSYYVEGFGDTNKRGTLAQLNPNIDAIQEFKMEVSGYSAEYGRMAGGVINVVLRSGTNQYHGSLFEYFRNNIFAARAFFSANNLDLNQNQWGGIITGPVRIPKLYNGHDRTFFMLSEESAREVWGQNELGNVPTALERAGNFSQVVSNTGQAVVLKNPLNGNAPFPGNMIPTSMFNPIAINLAQFYPLPNVNIAQNNYQAFAKNISNWDSFVFKVDERISDKDSLSVNFGKRFTRNNTPWAGSNLGIFQAHTRDDREAGGLIYRHMFSPALLMEWNAGMSRGATFGTLTPTSGGVYTGSQLGIQGSTTDPRLEGFPWVRPTNYLSLGYNQNDPSSVYITDIQGGGKFTWIKAGHIVKWGFTVSRNRYAQPDVTNARGTITPTGSWTGDAFADLMLGMLNASTITAQTAPNYMLFSNYGSFINDDWKITRSLTLNLGLRYEINTPPTDAWGRMSNFIPSLGKIVVASTSAVPNFAQLAAQAGLTNLVGTASQYGLPQSLVYPDYKCFAPRLGFAWRPFGGMRTVLRGGYGMFYTGTELNSVRVALDDNYPFVVAKSFARVTTNPSALSLANPWPQALATLTGTTTTSGYQLHAPLGYLQSYNLTLERELGKGLVLETAYVGSKGTHLSREYNLNMPVRSIPWYMANGTNFPAAYPQLSTITYYDFGSNSIYSAGRFTLRKRATNGVFYSLNYSYSKSIDYASQLATSSTGGFAQALDPRNLRLERARSDFDRGHVVTAVFSQQLPVGRGKHLLPDAGRLLNGIVGGWQLAANMIFETGAPFTVEDSSINQNIGQSIRPNRIFSGYKPLGAGKRGVNYPWYAPSAFATVPGCISRTNCSPDQYGFMPFAPGNSGRGILDGPGMQNINLNLLKNWYMGERKRVQFRWEVFNVFNHANFLLPDRNFNETAAGYVSDQQASGSGGPRIMQFALRYEF